MQTYTVLYPCWKGGKGVIDRHLSVEDAADAVLSYDGTEWRIDGRGINNWAYSSIDAPLVKAPASGWHVYAIPHLDRELAIGSSGRARVCIEGNIIHGVWLSDRQLMVPDADLPTAFSPINEYVLCIRREQGGRGWLRTSILGCGDTRDSASKRMFEAVVNTVWPCGPEAMTDEMYDRVMLLD